MIISTKLYILQLALVTLAHFQGHKRVYYRLNPPPESVDIRKHDKPDLDKILNASLHTLWVNQMFKFLCTNTDDIHQMQAADWVFVMSW